MSPFHGVVKWFEPAHERGFIRSNLPDGEEFDAIVYRSSIADPRYETLVPTERVEFEIQETPSGLRKAIQVQSLIPSNGRERGEVVDFSHLEGNGYILADGSTDPVMVERDSIMGAKMHEKTLEAGERVEFKRKSNFATAVKRLHATSRLYRWAVMGKESDWLAALRRIAAQEEGDWNYSVHPSHQKYPVLKSYLKYTFKQLEEEAAYGAHTFAISGQGENQLAAFNTGLETEYYTPIYAMFRLNDSPAAPSLDVHRPDWKLEGFFQESDGPFRRAFGGSPPIQATYYTDLTDLLFYPDRRRSLDKEHIVKDNLKRFPEYIWRDKPLQQAREEAVSYLEAMWVKTMRRVERNYKVAVPQYYCGQLQLLLPLYLLDGKSADLAAVASHCFDDSGNPYYDVATALTLDQAYNNARLLTKPDKDWLRP